MNHTFNFHFSLDLNNQPEYLSLLPGLTVKIQKEYFDINIYDYIMFDYKKRLLGANCVNWYVGSVTTTNVDLLAFIHQFLGLLPPPIIFGIDLNSLDEFCSGKLVNPELRRIYEDLQFILDPETDVKEYIVKRILRKPMFDKNKIKETLRENGYLDTVPSPRKPLDYFALHKNVNQKIIDKDYKELGNLFLLLVGNEITIENFKENLYLKRINHTQITAADILPLRPLSKDSAFIIDNRDEFINCIDEILLNDNGKIEYEFHEILNKCVPTIESLLESKNKKLFSYENGRIVDVENKDKSEIGSFYLHPTKNIICYCNKGYIYDFYPDPIHAARIINQPVIDKSYLKIWTTLDPAMYQLQIENGYSISSLDAYKHVNWKFAKREPDFTFISEPYIIIKNLVICNDIIFTGRSHKIHNTIYYEIDAIKYKDPIIVGNEIRNFTNTLFWNAENLLRSRHNLPKIGEGWLSEMLMYELISSNYPDSIHHFSPNWLKPQHFDVFIPSLQIAFEYQGKQHYEPVDFFGGNEGFQDNIRRDTQKYNLSIKNHIPIIYWRYDEPISYDLLGSKIKNIKKKSRK